MKNITLNTRLIIILACCCLLSILLACKTKKNSNCDAYGTINWEVNADTISVIKNDEDYVTDIPSNGAKSIHINTKDKGTYIVLLKSEGTIVDVKKFTIR
jgi:DNA-binding beta-propeller fold protein YncE